MLKKSGDAMADVNAALASSGKRYAKELNAIYKEIRKGNAVRKAFGFNG